MNGSDGENHGNIRRRRTLVAVRANGSFMLDLSSAEHQLVQRRDVELRRRPKIPASSDGCGDGGCHVVLFRLPPCDLIFEIFRLDPVRTGCIFTAGDCRPLRV
jgi:hypothetical protein